MLVEYTYHINCFEKKKLSQDFTHSKKEFSDDDK